MRDDSGKLILTKGKVAVSVMFDTVSIEISHGGDIYGAQSLYDEVISRLKASDGLTLKLEQTPNGG